MKINKITYTFIAGEKPALKQQLKENDKSTPKEIDLSKPVEIIDSVEESPIRFHKPERKDFIQETMSVWIPATTALLGVVAGTVLAGLKKM